MKHFGPFLLALAVATLLITGCRSTYYAAMEKVGVHKRDILKKRVVAARNDQKEAGAQFQSALDRLRELYRFEGGNLEKIYNELKRDYDRSKDQAAAVRKRIADVEAVAGDLFNEWETEIQQISSSALQAGSRQRLADARQRYEALHTALKKADASMDPVLVKLNDQVLYLKHNLNAQAIASLKGEVMNIQSEIFRLINEMNASIAKADEFIKALP